jgi:hypothetical protein
MVHLLVFVAVVDSDDLFFTTTFMSFAFGRKGGCLHGKERDFLHRIYNTHRILQGGVHRKEREFMESKEKEFGCQFFLYRSFFGVWWIFYWRANKA